MSSETANKPNMALNDLKFKARFLANSFKVRRSNSLVVERHEQLKKHYALDPKLAMITDSATVVGKDFDDPLRSEVKINDGLQTPLKTGLHSGVGGDNDYPNPGDILCAALASCMDGTLKMIANRLEIELTYSKVNVKAHVDTRGTLMFDKSVSVGFQFFELNVEIEASNVGSKILTKLFHAAKRSCVVYQTLKAGTRIETKLKIVNSHH